MSTEPFRCLQGRSDVYRAVQMSSGPSRCLQGRPDVVRIGQLRRDMALPRESRRAGRDMVSLGWMLRRRMDQLR